MCNESPRCSRDVPNSEYCKATTNPLESWDSGSCRRFCQFVCNMAEATAEEKGKSIFLDVSIYSRLVLLTSVQFCIFYVLFGFYIARLTAAICIFLAGI